MGRIEYWLLGAVGALIGFIVFEGATPAETRRTTEVVQQAKAKVEDPVRSRGGDSVITLTTVTAGSGDVRTASRRSMTPRVVRNVAAVRRRIAEGASGTYLVDMLESQDSVLYRWPDSRDRPLRVWVQSDPKIRNWWIGYVQTVRETIAEWETAGLPIRFEYPADSTGADIVIRWIEQFPSNELRIGKTRRLADPNAWVKHAEIVVALHDREGDSFPPDEVTEILRHEIGHALGLGHSKDRGTIMYPENTQLDITSLDRETLRLLYTLPPGSVK
jgi:predicted Zn-dependent protease